MATKVYELSTTISETSYYMNGGHQLSPSSTGHPIDVPYTSSHHLAEVLFLDFGPDQTVAYQDIPHRLVVWCGIGQPPTSLRSRITDDNLILPGMTFENIQTGLSLYYH
ncbi:hypothetical protein SARC_12238 [Sphaeroforma arctica JP610]|uniref:Uncharacterized protein n=1 Tax=Sphaeroforma arctica JP610 TaxID=667725 RepID=A0A0L0FGR3_9EUKA|nr:hypothetical protein SARC_12238 [Sphaeroforma arctica JP610]KNC75233.1 hypothetical protein SARC_12238 [Sphaeroforma arctica JP610]|eukprot:XP_014149135.1 hypothetical protein SARC_12238 [Sphaeroforma arctica JP610]